MPNLDTLSNAELYNEVAELAREQGITNQEEWHELCDEVIDDHLNLGELDPDQDIEGKRAALHLGWERYRMESAPESERAIDEAPEAPHD